MGDCLSIWSCVPPNFHSLGNYHAGIYVFWNVSIIWENTRSIFVFCKFTFVTSVSLGSLFFTINYRKKIFTVFFTKKLFKNLGSNNICAPRLFAIIFVILFLDTNTNYNLGSVRNILFCNVHTLQLLLVTTNLGQH